MAFAWWEDPDNPKIRTDGQLNIVTGVVEFRNEAKPTVGSDGSPEVVGELINPAGRPPVEPWHCTAMAFNADAEGHAYLLKVGEVIEDAEKHKEAIRQNPDDFNTTGNLKIKKDKVRGYYTNDATVVNSFIPEGLR